MVSNFHITCNSLFCLNYVVAEGDQIWRRDCIKTDFTGCKADKRDNGTHQWDIEWCVCEEPLCNMKMGDVSTSSTAKTTTSQGNISSKNNFALFTEVKT